MDYNLKFHSYIECTSTPFLLLVHGPKSAAPWETRGVNLGIAATWINSPTCSARTCRANKTQRRGRGWRRAYHAFCDSDLGSARLMTEEETLPGLSRAGMRDGRRLAEIDVRVVKLTPGTVNYRERVGAEGTMTPVSQRPTGTTTTTWTRTTNRPGCVGGQINTNPVAQDPEDRVEGRFISGRCNRDGKGRERRLVRSPHCWNLEIHSAF